MSRLSKKFTFQDRVSKFRSLLGEEVIRIFSSEFDKNA